MSNGWLSECPSKEFTDGTHRCCSPSETLSRIERHFQRIGITRIADVTGLDSLAIPTYLAIRPNSRSLSVSQGKGLTSPAAKVSAAMESIELYHAEHFVQCHHSCSFKELVGGRIAACDPAELPLHPRSDYSPQDELPWVKGIDLIGGIETLVPYDLIHTWYKPRRMTRPLFLMTSNGLASGNHRLEAVTHALCEIIERDAGALWEIESSLPGAHTRQVDLTTISCSPVLGLLSKLRAAGVLVEVFDQTSDLGIPCFRATVSERVPDGSPCAIGNFAGMGCHLSKEIALIRALTEAAQSRLTMISGARDDMYRSAYRVIQNGKWRVLPRAPGPRVDFAQVPSTESSDFRSDVEFLLGRLKRKGFDQVIAVDLTQPDLNIPVVRCVIPGMEPHLPDGVTCAGRRARLH